MVLLLCTVFLISVALVCGCLVCSWMMGIMAQLEFQLRLTMRQQKMGTPRLALKVFLSLFV
jgi:hypothetical protein